VEPVERRGSVLHDGPLGVDGEVLSLNLAQGCVQRCSFCTARAYPSYPGDDVVFLYANTPLRLDAELRGRRRKPHSIFLSPSTDPFMPLAEIQSDTCRVVEVLASHRVEAWLMTRGYIRPAARAVLIRHKESVKVTVGVTTLDRTLQRTLEPLAAPPALRLRQISELRSHGVNVQVELAPLLPGLTDTAENLRPLLAALAQAGVRQVTAGYLFLRPGIQRNLEAALARYGWHESVLASFTGGPLLYTDDIATARYLPKARRQRGYAALKALAADVGISVTISRLANPDFTMPRSSGSPAGTRLGLLAQAWERTTRV
jgi:DNA repair photolyase